MSLRRSLIVLVAVASLPASAQDSDGNPLSAIDWLSQSVQTPIAAPEAPTPTLPVEPPIADNATSPGVTVTALDNPSPDGTGLLAPAVTGLPRSLWSASDAETLSLLVRAERVETLPALQDLLITLMLAEADPPSGAGPQGDLFLARVDKLLDIGALEQAQALLEAADPTTPELFRRWFDVALLTGTEDQACTTLRDHPDLAPTIPARVFCLARNGDWQAGALILNTARALGDITDADDALLSRFLDPDLYEGEDSLTAPERMTPLVFRMHEAIGEGLTTAGLPRAFAHADLRQTTGWKAQLEAAERLARSSAIDPNVLFGLYLAHTPAASGGIWDRARAVQTFDAALKAGDDDAVAAALPTVWAAMQNIRAEVAFARVYSPAVSDLTLPDESRTLVFHIALLSPDYEAAALAATPTGPTERFLQGLAQGDLSGQTGDDSNSAAIAAAFDLPPAEDTLTVMAGAGKLGEAILRALALFDQGVGGDPTAITASLALLRSVGLEDQARRTALQLLLLDRPA